MGKDIQRLVKCCSRSWRKVLGSISIGKNTRIGAGSVVVKDVDDNCTVVGIPGRVVHQSGTKINPLEHSALPDTEAQMIRSLMNRIDELEKTIVELKNSKIGRVKNNNTDDAKKRSRTENPRDREVLDLLGE